MDTPICDFVSRYVAENALRLHMPGHKGAALLGMEQLDITEIPGADSLYEASGIIRASEANASSLFGCRTFYSTEGSSHCIRAMLYLCLLQAKQQGRNPLILAGRNAHKTFLSGATLLDLDVKWLQSHDVSYLSCVITPAELEQQFAELNEKPMAVYLTSPDYLGNCADIAGIARVCRQNNVPLLVDNAHGAYLKFLQPSQHPIDLGADMCCDSAHKTLPALTGAAYLHFSDRVPDAVVDNAKNALALFGSTSPSYLILQSLDRVNAYIADGYAEKLHSIAVEVCCCKARLQDHGYTICGTEALKFTIAPKSLGYTGVDLANLLQSEGVVCEFADPDYVVFMVAPETGKMGLAKLEECLLSLQKRNSIKTVPPAFGFSKRVMSVREATLSPCERIPVSQAIGRVLASPSVGCPPAVPILMCGEEINAHDVACFAYYGIEWCWVVQ